MNKWRYKVAVIVGSVSSISRRLIEDFTKLELNVVLLVKNANEITLTTKIPVYTHECDIFDPDSITAAFRWVEATLGAVHILINSPGCNKHLTKSTDDAENELFSIINTNLVMGFLLCSKEAVLSMRKHNVDGYVININSTFDHQVPIIPGVPPYNGPLTSTTGNLRRELTILKNEKIRMTSLNPGLVRTEIVGTDKYPVNMLYNKYPTLTAEDISQAVQYILSAPAHVEISELTIKPTAERGPVLIPQEY